MAYLLPFFLKHKIMARETGKPSGVDKSENRTGIPSNSVPGKMGENNEMTEKYTDDDNEISDNVRTGHPNRNTDKGDATNIGGYRN
jgi:hypothetical protein